MDDITLLYTEDLHTALGYWVHPGVPLPNMSDIKRAANPWIPRHSFDTPKYHMITKPPREDSQIRLITTLVLGLLIHLPYQMKWAVDAQAHPFPGLQHATSSFWLRGGTVKTPELQP